MKDAFIFAGVLVCAVAGVVLALLGALAVLNRVQAPADIAQIESLRRDSAGVSACEDVIRWNQRIAKAKAYNQLWYTDWLVPDIWDSVNTLPLHTEQPL